MAKKLGVFMGLLDDLMLVFLIAVLVGGVGYYVYIYMGSKK